MDDREKSISTLIDDWEKFISTLNEAETKGVYEAIGNMREANDRSIEDLIEQMTFEILWDYKVRIETANEVEAKRLARRKRELYTEWIQQGIIKE